MVGLCKGRSEDNIYTVSKLPCVMGRELQHNTTCSLSLSAYEQWQIKQLSQQSKNTKNDWYNISKSYHLRIKILRFDKIKVCISIHVLIEKQQVRLSNSLLSNHNWI